MQLRHCSFLVYVAPMSIVSVLLVGSSGQGGSQTQRRAPQGNSDYLFKAQPALTGSTIGVSFQSVNYPSNYLTIVTATNTAEGSLRIGNADPSAARDNATWLILPGLVGGYNTYSFQARGGAPRSHVPHGFSLLPPSNSEHTSSAVLRRAEYESHGRHRWSIHDSDGPAWHGVLRLVWRCGHQ